MFPDGFTGFRRSGESPVPSIDLAVFKAVCRAAARLLSGTIVEIEFADVTPNFHCATFQWGYEQTRVCLLCNRAYYIVGFCRPRHGCVNEYVDAPDLAAALACVSNWQVLSKVELEAVIDDSSLNSMSEPDRKIVEKALRKPWFGPARTVGDFLFHYAD